MDTCLDRIPAPRWRITPAAGNRALVTLRGSDSIVVRDVTSIDYPHTVGTLPNLGRMKFVSGGDVSGSDYGNASRLVFDPVGGQPAVLSAGGCQNVFDYAWSSDGSKVVYVTNDESRWIQQLREISGGVDRVIAVVPKPIPVSGCVACSDNADIRLAYSTDRRYISLVGWGTFEVWRADGALVSGPSVGGAEATMSIWSGSGLYFRDDRGVRVWRDGVVSTVLPGVQWIRPESQPQGDGIVYQARDSKGQGHVFLLDTTNRTTRTLVTSERMEPAFLTARYVWYAGEVVCPVSDGCYRTGYQWQTATKPTGVTYIYDLLLGTETQSRITSVLDVWPH